MTNTTTTNTRSTASDADPAARKTSKTTSKTAGKAAGKAKTPRKRSAPKKASTSAPRTRPTIADTTRELLYERVAGDLRDQIVSGKLPPGTVLPTEPQLEQTYGVARATARSAIAVLRAEGLVTVLHGKGAFVRRNPTDRPTHTHTRTITTTGDATGGSVDGQDGYADGDIDDGWWPVEEPSTYQTEATPAIALYLGVVEHTPLFGTDRLLQNGSGRRVLHRVYIPMTTVLDAVDNGATELEQDPYVGGGRLYSLLAKAGHRLTWTEYVTARNPSPDDTNTLRVPDGTPVITTRRITHDTQRGPGKHGIIRRPLALEETHRSADDTQLAYPLTPTTTATTA